MPTAEELYRAVTGHCGPLPTGAESWEACLPKALNDHGMACTEDLSETYFLDRISRRQYDNWMNVHHKRLNAWWSGEEVWPTTVQDLQTEATADMRALYTTPAPRAARLSEARRRSSERKDAEPRSAPKRRAALDERMTPVEPPVKAPAGFCTELLKLYHGGKTVKEVITLALAQLQFPASKASEREAYVRNRTAKLLRVGAIRRG